MAGRRCVSVIAVRVPRAWRILDRQRQEIIQREYRTYERRTPLFSFLTAFRRASLRSYARTRSPPGLTQKRPKDEEEEEEEEQEESFETVVKRVKKKHDKEYDVDGADEITLSNGKTYVGETLNGKPHGRGKEYRYQYVVRKGNWVYGKLHGKGWAMLRDGSTVEGLFESDQPAKETAFKRVFGDGTIYEGFVDQWFVPNGMGRLIALNPPESKKKQPKSQRAHPVVEEREEEFELWCLFRDGAPVDGKGKLITEERVYEGDLFALHAQGVGRARWRVSGDRYEGEWVDDFPHGVGVYTKKVKKDGKVYRDVYKGEVSRGVANGRGVLEMESRGLKLDGEWQENVPHGKVITYKLSSGEEIWRADWREGKVTEVKFPGIEEASAKTEQEEKERIDRGDLTEEEREAEEERRAGLAGAVKMAEDLQKAQHQVAKGMTFSELQAIDERFKKMTAKDQDEVLEDVANSQEELEAKIAEARARGEEVETFGIGEEEMTGKKD